MSTKIERESIRQIIDAIDPAQLNPFLEHLDMVNRKLLAASRVPAEYLRTEQRSRGVVQWLPGGVPVKIGAGG